MWDQNDTTSEIKSNEDFTFVDTDDDQSEVKRYKNHNYVGILAFGLQDEPHTYSTCQCEKFGGELEFYEIVASTSQAKPWKVISMDHLIKVCRINLESSQMTLCATTQKGLMNDSPKLTTNFGTGYRMLRYQGIRKNFFMYTLFLTNKYGK